MLLVTKVGDEVSGKGWIKLHRKLMDNPIFDNPNLLRVWLWCLLKASHDHRQQMIGLQIVDLEPGQFVTGRFKGSDELKINPSTFYKYLKTLEKLKMINLKSNNKMTIVTIENWRKYQVEDAETYQQNNNKISTKEQQNNTNKNDKNDKNNTVCMYSENLKEIVSLLEQNIGIIPPVLIDEINEYSNIFSVDMFREAIKIAANRKKRHVNYVLGVLRQWKDNNIITINDLEALRREKELEKEQRAQEKDNKQYTKPKNRFHNFEQRTDKYTADQLEEIARKKREEYYKKVQESGN